MQDGVAPLADGLRLVQEANDAIKEMTDDARGYVGKENTNGPKGTISKKTLESVQMMVDNLLDLQAQTHRVNPHYEVDLQSCLTLQVESLHAVHHHKTNDLPHMLEHAIAFGNTVRESIKQMCKWAAYYYTGNESYYPVPHNQIQLQDIPQMGHLPVVHQPLDRTKQMIAWAQAYGKTLKQKSVRQQTCSYSCNILPLNCYDVQEPLGELA